MIEFIKKYAIYCQILFNVIILFFIMYSSTPITVLILKMVLIFSVTISALYYSNKIIVLFLPKSQNKRNTKLSNDNITNGRKIGFYERILYFIGIISQNWNLIVIVVALKTVSRYQELDKQLQSEYFLIGSLLSLIISIIISGIFIGCDTYFGLGIVKYILDLVNFNIKVI